MIEAHLRMGDIDRFMNVDLMQNIIDVYKGKEWKYREEHKKFFLFALFAPHSQDIVFPSEIIKKVKHEATFFQIDDTDQANPPSGKRVAVLGAYDKELGISLRNLLIDSAQPPIMDEYIATLLGRKSI
tara:strand:- start:86 stop:469 length:384 start_codon:yes stop_codon:yes gene_type:complete